MGRVLIVEDHGLLAESLLYALRAEGVEAETLVPASAEQIIEAAERFTPTVVLLDLDLRGDIGSSLPLIAPLHDLGAQVVMVTGVSDRVRLAECLEAGATGLISKSRPFDELVAGIREVAELGTLISPLQRDELLAELRRQRASERARLKPFERLTPREQYVLAGLMAGKAADVIARDAFVSLATVRSQIRSILLKLGVNSQLAAVAVARQNHWTPAAE